MDKKVILLVEDAPDEEVLTIHALEKSNNLNEVVVAHDGIEALHYLFGSGSYSIRKASDMPDLILLDLKLPYIHGLEVLRRIRSDERTKLIPVVHTHLIERGERPDSKATNRVSMATFVKPWTSSNLAVP